MHLSIICSVCILWTVILGVEVQAKVEEGEFVRVQNGQFVVGSNCTPIHFVGWNSAYLYESLQGVEGWDPDPSILESVGIDEDNILEGLVEYTNNIGFNLVTIPAFPSTLDTALDFEDCDEVGMVYVDKLLDTLSKYGMYAQISLGGYSWSRSEYFPASMQWFTEQAGMGLSGDYQFLSNQDIIELYKERMECIIYRNNTINGKRYAEDATIMGWILIEEIQCRDCDENNRDNIIKSWTQQVASYLKQLDQNHLVTIGEDGFYNDNCTNAENQGLNKNSFYAKLGQNSVVDHSLDEIDYIGFTYYPDAWFRSIEIEEDNEDYCNNKKQAFLKTWFYAKQQEAQLLHKPLMLLGTTAKTTSLPQFYNSILDLMGEDLVEGSGSFMGVVTNNLCLGQELREASLDLQGKEMKIIETFVNDTLKSLHNDTTQQCGDEVSKLRDVSEEELQLFSCTLNTTELIEAKVCLPQNNTGYIIVKNGTLVEKDSCKKFSFIGLRSWRLMWYLGNPKLYNYLDLLKSSGFHVISTIAPLKQSRSNQIDEKFGESFDEFLYELSKRDMKVIISFADNFPDSFSQAMPTNLNPRVLHFVNETNIIHNRSFQHDDFFSEPLIKNYFQEYIGRVIDRKNSITNYQYHEDPTIMAWNLVQGAKCRQRVDRCLQNNNYQRWILQMTHYIKQLDVNHLVAPGNSGFYQQVCWRSKNPAQWASFAGPASMIDDNITTVDYISFDYLPYGWRIFDDLNFAQRWFQAKEKQAAILNKPIILHKLMKEKNQDMDEKMRNNVDTIFEFVFSVFKKSVQEGGKLQGIFWTDWNFDKPDNINKSITQNSSTWNIIQKFTQGLQPYLFPNTPLPPTCNEDEDDEEGLNLEENLHISSVSFVQQVQDSCGKMPGYLVSKKHYELGYTDTAQQCCDACQDDDGCEGWSWCGCEGGCQIPYLSMSYDTYACLAKKLPSTKFAQNITADVYGVWISGIPIAVSGRDIQFQSEVQVSGTCGSELHQCSHEQIQANLVPPDQNCNVFQGMFDLGTAAAINGLMDLNSVYPGVPITTAQECCKACEMHEICNMFSFCNSPFGCDRCPDNQQEWWFGIYGGCVKGRFPPWMCTLKVYNSTKDDLFLTEVGPMTPWIFGYIEEKFNGFTKEDIFGS